MFENLTTRQRKAIESLLTTGSRTEAVRAAGITRQTLSRWFKQPHFVAALRQAEAEALRGLSLSLLSLAEGAAGALAAGLEDESATVRLRAADLILQRLLQVREMLDWEGRITALEELVIRRSA